MNQNRQAINAFYQKNKRFTGENYNSLYMRFQNDYYLGMNIFHIKNRKSHYAFAPGFKMMDNGLSKKLKGDSNDYKTYLFKKNNEYLGSKILQISTRNKGQKKAKTNSDFLATIRTKGNSYAKLREMEKERIKTENAFYQTRIRNSNSQFKKSNYAQFAKDQMRFSMNLRKIFPIGGLQTSEGFYNSRKQKTQGSQRYKTEGSRELKTSQNVHRSTSELPPIEKKEKEENKPQENEKVQESPKNENKQEEAPVEDNAEIPAEVPVEENA